jgi:hypothetical protein
VSEQRINERRALAAFVLDRAEQYMRGRYKDFAQEIAEAIAIGRHVEMYEAGDFDDLLPMIERLFATGYLSIVDPTV